MVVLVVLKEAPLIEGEDDKDCVEDDEDDDEGALYPFGVAKGAYPEVLLLPPAADSSPKSMPFGLFFSDALGLLRLC